MVQGASDKKELDNILSEPLPWEVKRKRNTAMTEHDVSDWSSMIGSGPG